MPIFTGCIPEGIASLVIFDEGDCYMMRVWHCFGMFATSGEGIVTRPDLQSLMSLARFYGFVLEEV